MLFNLTGCATTPKLTSLQKRVMQSKELEGTFDSAFKATISVLQDEGYTIKSSDFSSGLIYAELDSQVAARPSPGWLLLTPFYGAGLVVYATLKCGKANYCYKATINLEKFTEDRVKMRLSISGIFNNQKTEPVEDPKIYQGFYAEVQKEMFRRAQLNK